MIKRDRVLVQHQYAVDGVGDFGAGGSSIRVMRGENHAMTLDLIGAEQRLQG